MNLHRCFPFLTLTVLLLGCNTGGGRPVEEAKMPSDTVFTVSVTDYGAVGDGMTLNTEAIQQCIDAVSAHPSGGRVWFGPGRWLMGMVSIRSNVELYLDKEATLLGSTNPYDYEGGSRRVGKRGDEDVSMALIVSDSASNIRITGQGTVDAQGLDLALAIDSLHHIGERIDPNYNHRRHRPTTRPKLFFLAESENIFVHGITLRNSAGWGLSLHDCTNVVIDSVTVVNRGYWNNDGIDMNDCRNVVVRNCDVNAADDGICLKSDNPDNCCDGILIENCKIVSSASAVKFGTSSYGGFRNVTVRNIRVRDTFRSAIALETVDGGVLENVTVENIEAKNTGNPLFIRLGARHPYGGTTDKREGGICRNITIRNLKAEVPFGRPDADYDLRGPEVNYFHNPWPSSITGIPGRFVENVAIENVDIIYPGRATKGMAYVGLYRVKEVDEAEQGYPEFTMFGELPSWAFYVRHVRGLTMKNIRVSLKDEDFRPAFVFDDVQGLSLTNLNQPDTQIFKIDCSE